MHLDVDGSCIQHLMGGGGGGGEDGAVNCYKG